MSNFIHRFLSRQLPYVKYNNKLEPHIWAPNGDMNTLVSNSLKMIAWGYIAYLQRVGLPISDDMIFDIFVHGSTTNYYYNDFSDIDICIVADLNRLQALLPNVDLYILLKAMLGAWLRNYRIRVCGRGVDIEIVNAANPKYGPGAYKVGSAYSILADKWIHEPIKLSRTELRNIRRSARKKYRMVCKMYRKIKHDKMASDFIETFLMRMMHDRKESYAQNSRQPITAETMAFRLVRQRGILRKLNERAARQRSRNFNLST